MSYRYEQLAPVLFGCGMLKELGPEAKKLGCTRVLCVYGGSIKRTGIGARAEESLRSAGVDVVTYDQMGMEPTIHQIDEVVQLAKEAKVDGVVGLGGGSSQDGAKAIAIMLDKEGPVEQFLTAPPSWVDSPVPIIMVPTTSGTGSEVTQVSVLSHPERNEKLAVMTRPHLAILDPELTLSVPAEVTVTTGLDALAHAVEAITAKGRNPHSEVLALGAIQKIMRYLPAAYKNGDNLEARSQLLLASNWAGIAFADTNVQFGHAAADAISAQFHTSHGLNCGWVTPMTLEIVSEETPLEVQRIGETMGLTFVGMETAEELGRIVADEVRRFMKKLNVPTMRSLGIDRDSVLACAHYAAEVSGLRFNCPVEITREVALRYFAGVYDLY